MPRKRPRCFVHVPVGPPRPVESLKFGVIARDGKALSGIWTVAPHSNPKRCDVFVSATGLQGSSKFSFHGDVLNHAWLFEKHGHLVEEGIARPGSRQWQQVPITGLPWHGLTVRFVDCLLRKQGHSIDKLDGDVVALEPPEAGEVLDVGFILADGTGLQVNQAQFCIGEVGGGGRAAVVVGRYSKQDTLKQKEDYRSMIANVAPPKSVIERLSPNDELAMLLFGEEGGAIIVTEVHNVRYTPSIE